MSPASIARQVTSTMARQNPWFWAFAFLVVCFVYVRLPSQLERPELWAEAGQNYFLHARHAGLFANLATPDAGYLPLGARLVAVVVVTLFGVIENFALVTQCISVVLIALMSSFITLRAFRPLIESDSVRMLIGLMIGCGTFANYEMYTIVNFAYFGLFPVFLSIFLNKDEMKQPSYLGVNLMVVTLILSKAFFIVFGPVFCLLMVLDARARRWKSAVFDLLALTAACGQLLFMQTHPHPFRDSKGLKYAVFSPFEFLTDVTLYYGRAICTLFLSLEPPRDPVATTLFVFVGLALLTYWAARAGDQTMRRFLWTAHATAFLSTCVWIMVSGLAPYSVNIPISLQVQRQTFFTHGTLLLLACVPLLRLLPNDSARVAAMALLAMSGSEFRTGLHDYYYDRTASHSQWRTYASLARDSEYCIPVNPYPSVVLRALTVLNADRHYPIFSTPLVDLAWWGREASGWETKVVPLDRKSASAPPLTATQAAAYDEGGRELARAVRLTPPENQYQYFLFDKRVNAAQIRFFDADSKPVGVTADALRLVGVARPDVIIDSPGQAPQRIGELVTGDRLRVQHAGFGGLSIKFSTSGRPEPADVRVTLTDRITKTSLLDQTVPGKHLRNDDFFHFRWLAQPDSAGREYLLEIVSPNATPENAVTIWASAAAPDQPGITLNGSTRPGLTLTHKQVFDQRR